MPIKKQKAPLLRSRAFNMLVFAFVLPRLAPLTLLVDIFTTFTLKRLYGAIYSLFRGMGLFP